MKTINILGSTGIIGTKSLKIINSFFPKLKINLLVANKNYKKLAYQANLYNSQNICLIDSSKNKKLRDSISNKKINILNKDDLNYYLNETISDLTILSISGYESLNFIESIIKNTKNLGIVNKECIVNGGYFIKKLCKLYNTNLYALDSEHFSIQNFIELLLAALFLTKTINILNLLLLKMQLNILNGKWELKIVSTLLL